MKVDEWWRWMFPKRLIWDIKQRQRKFWDDVFSWWRMK